MRRLRFAAVTVAALSVAALTARGFVRSVTDKGTAIYWQGTSVTISPDMAGTPDLPFDKVLAVITRSIAAWQNPTFGPMCSYLKILLGNPAPLEAHFDHLNAIKFRTDKWCRPAEPNTMEMCYSASAAAITTVFYDSNPGGDGDGAIIDADIQLNDLDFTFIIKEMGGAPRTRTMIADLENTLVHELGHFQGLDHTCWDHSSSRDPIDNNGKPIPDCTAVQDHTVPGYTDADYKRITQSTMYNYAQAGETIKRTPKADDVAGICGIYPWDKAPQPGCAVGGLVGAPTGIGLLLLPLFVMGWRRRRTTERACSRIRTP